MPSNKLHPALTISMYQKQNGKCAYCDHILIVGDREYAPTVDHIYPRVSGGNSLSGNICIACKKCNQIKGSLPVELFLLGYKSCSGYIQGYTEQGVRIRGPKRWYHGNIIKW